METVAQPVSLDLISDKKSSFPGAKIDFLISICDPELIKLAQQQEEEEQEEVRASMRIKGGSMVQDASVRSEGLEEEK